MEIADNAKYRKSQNMQNHVFWPERGLYESSGTENWWIRHRISRRSHWDRSQDPEVYKKYKTRIRKLPSHRPSGLILNS